MSISTHPSQPRGTATPHPRSPMRHPRNDRMLTREQLAAAIESGEVDSVILAFTDMQGRLQGKVVHGRFFLDSVMEHGAEACNYLLAVDTEMNTVGGYSISR